MKAQILVSTAMLLFGMQTTNAQPIGSRYPHDPRAVEIQEIVANDNTKIQVALLLDTSNSMDGLIDQAKSRLWNIINTITSLKYKGKTPKVEIALYEYGNDNLSVQNNYIRKVTDFTTDLDLISEKLFSLRTNGGQEYCGAVIHKSISELEWSRHHDALKFIYIAGNEPFNQGNIKYTDAINNAVRKKVYVNTIFCGNDAEGRNTHWSDGARRGNGTYFSINSDEKIRYIETPYDDRLDVLNSKLNDTYIAFGAQGYERQQSQLAQDANAASISKANKAERAVSKSKAIYKNEDWDLVDKVAAQPSAIEQLKESELPTELQGKSTEEKRRIISGKEKERKNIQAEIADLSKKREHYITEENKKLNNNAGDDLGSAINKSIIEVAKKNGYGLE